MQDKNALPLVLVYTHSYRLLPINLLVATVTHCHAAESSVNDIALVNLGWGVYVGKGAVSGRWL